MRGSSVQEEGSAVMVNSQEIHGEDQSGSKPTRNERERERRQRMTGPSSASRLRSWA